MLKTRLIPILFLKNGLIVRSETFSDFREIGNPINQLKRLSDWEIDELIYVDITREGGYDLKRSDHKIKGKKEIISILKEIAKSTSMPLTFGGRIKSIEQVDAYMANGADKVIINTGVYDSPELISNVSSKYGSQAIVVGIDIKKEGTLYNMYVKNGQKKVKDDPLNYAKKVESLGAGEIFINSIDRDGTGKGYDINIIKKIISSVNIPVIAAGGAGTFDDFIELAEETCVSAIAAGNIFNFTEHAYPRAKKELKRAGINVR